MTQDEIIEMARQAGFAINELHCSPPIITFVGQEEVLEAFAKLVAQHEREACIELTDSRCQCGGLIQSRGKK
jgi:hypothetical protein